MYVDLFGTDHTAASGPACAPAGLRDGGRTARPNPWDSRPSDVPPMRYWVADEDF